MKIKSYIVVSIIAMLVIFLFFPKSQTPYSGAYHGDNTNVELILKADNSFNLHLDNYRNSISIGGKYQISNNHISLFTKDKNDEFFIKDISSGEVTGSIITFKNGINSKPITFIKS